MSHRASFRAQPKILFAALLGMAALTNACGNDAQATHSRPIAGCEMHDLAPCDARTRECESSRFELAACLRGAKGGEPPPITLMTEEAYAAYINGSSEGRAQPTNHYEIAMTWLGLAKPGSFDFVPVTPESLAGWLGTYRWRSRDLLVIDRGKPADDVASNVALVAAMIRALRDRDIQISTWATQASVFDADSTWGADAMYFGEARLFSNRYRAALEGREPTSLDELAQINAGIREDIAWIRAQPSTYLATNERFAANFGARALYFTWRRGGMDAVNYLYADKLLTQQLMADETAEAPLPSLKYHARPRAPDAWNQDAWVTAVGAWGLYLSLSRAMTSDAAWSLALAWSGEQLFVYKAVEPSQDTALVWQLEMANEAAASALAASLSADGPGGKVQRTGTFVTLAIASNDDPLDWAFVTD
ncbi:MAG TPA: hypothetical protein VHM25_05560 [Polyangiaceae bacterium]|jgi:hypothetical protein|nr:hypothetical protein [Polyangiaceae bacterium]